MKYAFLTCLVSLIAVSAYGQDTIQTKKYYCDSHQIEVTDSMILVHLGDTTFEIDTLLVDQGGIYFLQDMLRCTHCRRTLNPKNTCECSTNHG